MKINIWILVAGIVSTSFVQAQDRQQPRLSRPTNSASIRAPGKHLPEKRSRATLANRAPDEVGPHSRTWVETKTQGAGHVRPNGRIVEITTGMHYWNGATWAPSEATFEAGPDGFTADRVQHKVFISRQLNVAGAVSVITPDGIRLRSTPVAIALYDAESGESSVIARVRDTAGAADKNQVLFENAFDENGVSASVLYTLEKGSFEQDVIITGRLDPADYGFPPNSTRIQIFTEFYDAPEPDRIRRPIRTETKESVRSKMRDPDFVDQVLGFGEFVLANGKAFPLRGKDQARAPISKDFKSLGDPGRRFLIESLEYPSVERELKALPASRTAALDLRRRGGMEKQAADIPSARPISTVHVPNPQETKSLALALKARPGLVIDYIATIGGTVNSATVFSGDTTYFVSGAAIYNGSVTIEGGAIFKFRNSTGTTPAPVTTYIKINGSITSKSSQYLPAVFTAMDDDSVGEFIPDWVTDPNGNTISTGATGNIIDPGPDGALGTADDFQRYYGAPYLWLNYVYYPNLSNLRFLFGKEALKVEDNFQTSGAVISHSQFVNCIKGIVLTGGGGSSGTAVPLTVNNALMSQVDEPFTTMVATSLNVIRHCTINDSTRIATAAAGMTTSFSIVNCILANIPQSASGPASLSGNNNGFYNYTGTLFGQTTTRYVSASNPFIALGQASHYLAANSTLRQKGTTAVGTTLLNELKKRTTQPPLLIQFPTFLRGETLWTPTAARYVSGQPDLGYWYDPLDFLATGLTVFQGKLTIESGTVVGFLPDLCFDEWGDPVLIEMGLFLTTGGLLESKGSPLKPNRFVTSDVVQENASPWTPYSDGLVVVTMDGAENLPEASFWFTEFSVLGGFKSYSLLTGADNYGVLWDYGEFTKLQVRDCVFRSGQLNISQAGASTPGTIFFSNNLFERVYTTIYPYSVESSVEMRNNLFKNGHFDVSPGAQASIWVLTDNLFDRCPVTTGGLGAVSANYNAYWFSTDPQVRLQPVGANDKILTAAPPYQVSTLGSYYLPYNTSTSTLFSGSRSPGEAGLYHYTSRTTQVKDGEETEIPNSVNIGFHYVALVSGLPKDTDSDGIPDFIEDADGDGVLDSGIETSTSLSQTTTGIADSANAIYDDYSLDEDGMVGRIEKALSKNTLVADNPLTLTKVITGNEPDIVSFQVPISYSLVDYASPTRVGKLQLLMEGVPLWVDCQPDSGGLCVLSWETTFNSPGTHFLQAQFVLNHILSAGPDPDPAVITANGPVIQFTSENHIQFEPFYSEYNTAHGAILYALTPYFRDADYSIELKTVAGVHIKTITGSTSTGEIEELWDLTNDQGNPITYNEVDAIFTVAPTPAGMSRLNAGGSSSSKFRLYRVQDIYMPTDGAFTVAYGSETWTDEQDLHDCMQLTVVDQLIKPCNATFCYDHPYNSYFNTYSPPGTPGHLSSANAVTALLANLSNQNVPIFGEHTKNFYYFGHANPNNTGASYNSGISFFSVNDVAERLGNNSFTRGGRAGKIRLGEAYRFVFIDGCSTAMNSDWAHAFGIYDRITEKQLTAWPEKVQAYVGWDNLKKAPSQGYKFNMSSCYSVFWSAWQNGMPLDRCIWYASQDNPPPPISFMDLSAYNFGPRYQHWNRYQRWKHGLTGDARIRIYGYAGLTRTGFAPGYDNSAYYK